MAKRRTTADPHADREAERYDNPVASREHILSLLDDADDGLSVAQIRKAIGIESDAAHLDEAVVP